MGIVIGILILRPWQGGGFIRGLHYHDILTVLSEQSASKLRGLGFRVWTSITSQEVVAVVILPHPVNKLLAATLP